jgi:Fic family protein
MNILDEVEKLKSELDELRPLNSEAEGRIMQKFRLDWNFHSNNLEGNSLTYGETKALLLFGITAQGKPLQDHFEITGHNEAINWVMEIVKGHLPLTEKFIRELHTLLLREPSYKDAVTAEGKPTRRRIEVGKYKTQPNHVITVTGEPFYFASPEETPARMQELIAWFRQEKIVAGVNPVIAAALFHYRFIRIHPFDDGNGRVARILMNFILMQNGFPPVIIKTEDKENYYSVLQQADAGELEPFIDYIADNLIRSLEMMIKGATGEDIGEPEDLDKELALLERKIRLTGRKVETPRGKEAISNLFEDSIQKLILQFVQTAEKFDRFYVENRFTLFVDHVGVNRDKEDAMQAAREKINATDQGPREIQLLYAHTAFNQQTSTEGSFRAALLITFGTTKYVVSSGENYSTPEKETSFSYEKLYSEQLTSTEIASIMKLKAKEHMDYLNQVFDPQEPQN